MDTVPVLYARDTGHRDNLFLFPALGCRQSGQSVTMPSNSSGTTDIVREFTPTTI